MKTVRVPAPGARLVTWSLAFALLTSNAGEPPRAQQGTFRAGITMAPIDVRAFDRSGKPVTDLALEDFEIVEDGVRQRVAHISTQAAPSRDAFGYRFEAGGRSIVISGDTRPSENLVRHAKGVDILVLEAYLPEHCDRADIPEVAARLKSYHTSAEEAGQMAQTAGVKLLVLTHLIPAGADATFRERGSRHFRGAIAVGKDLMRC